MKKVLYVVLIVVLTAVMAGCDTANNDNNQEATPEVTATPEATPTAEPTATPGATGALKDGTYVGKADPWQYGAEDATVVVNDGKIKSVALRRLDTQGNEVNYDEWTGQEKDGKVYPNLKEYRETMANRMLEKQTYQVDAISGATVSTENWKIAVERALAKAK